VMEVGDEAKHGECSCIKENAMYINIIYDKTVRWKKQYCSIIRAHIHCFINVFILKRIVSLQTI